MLHPLARQSAIAVARRAGREPLRTAIVVVSLGLGVVLSGLMVSVAYFLVLQPPPHVGAPGEVVTIAGVHSYRAFALAASGTQTVELAAFGRGSADLGSGLRARTIDIECISANYLQVLRTPMFRGSAPGRHEAILAYSFWKSLGHPAVGEYVLDTSSGTFQVVGVLPEGFRGTTGRSPDAWVPLEYDRGICAGGKELGADLGSSWLSTIGRIRTPFLHAEVRAELQRLLQARGIPNAKDISVARLEVGIGRGLSGRTATWLLMAAFAVLLVALLNTAGLFLLDGLARTYEYSVHGVLGLTAAHLRTLVLFESAWMGMLAGGFVVLGSHVLPSVFAQRWDIGSVDLLPPSLWPVLFVTTIALCVCCAIPTALVAGNAARARHVRFRGVLLNSTFVVEIALALVLAVLTLLFARSVRELRSNSGFDFDGVAIVSVDLMSARYDADEIEHVFDVMQKRVDGVDGVIRTAVAAGALLNSTRSSTVWSLRAASGLQSDFVKLNAVSSGYFSVVGARIEHGRTFSEAENLRSHPVVIISRGLADELFPDADPIGQCLTIGRQRCVEVVGVTRPRKHGTLLLVEQEFFIPLSQARYYSSDILPQALLVRARQVSPTQMKAIAHAIDVVLPSLPYTKVAALNDFADVQTRRWRVARDVLGVLSILTMSMVAISLHVFSGATVRQRLQELAVRQALGARRRAVLWLVMRRASACLLTGIVIGVLLSLWALGLVRNLLFGFEGADFMTFAAPAFIVLGCGLVGAARSGIACVRIEPAKLLRASTLVAALVVATGCTSPDAWERLTDDAVVRAQHPSGSQIRSVKPVEGEPPPAFVRADGFNLRRSAVTTEMPVFPEESLRAGSRGVAVAALRTRRDGTVESVELLQSPDEKIAGEVRRALLRWVFAPTSVSGSRVPVEGRIVFYFEISAGKGVVRLPADPDGSANPVAKLARVTPDDLPKLKARESVVLLDIRERAIARRSPSPVGAKNIPLQEVDQRIKSEFAAASHVVIDCLVIDESLCVAAHHRISSLFEKVSMLSKARR